MRQPSHGKEMKKEKTEPVSKEPTTKERSNRRSPKIGGEFNAALLTQDPSRQTPCGRTSLGTILLVRKPVTGSTITGKRAPLSKASKKSSMRPAN